MCTGVCTRAPTDLNLNGSVTWARSKIHNANTCAALADMLKLSMYLGGCGRPWQAVEIW